MSLHFHLLALPLSLHSRIISALLQPRICPDESSRDQISAERHCTFFSSCAAARPGGSFIGRCHSSYTNTYLRRSDLVDDSSQAGW